MGFRGDQRIGFVFRILPTTAILPLRFRAYEVRRQFFCVGSFGFVVHCHEHGRWNLAAWGNNILADHAGQDS